MTETKWESSWSKAEHEKAIGKSITYSDWKIIIEDLDTAVMNILQDYGVE